MKRSPSAPMARPAGQSSPAGKRISDLARTTSRRRRPWWTAGRLDERYSLIATTRGRGGLSTAPANGPAAHQGQRPIFDGIGHRPRRAVSLRYWGDHPNSAVSPVGNVDAPAGTNSNSHRGVEFGRPRSRASINPCRVSITRDCGHVGHACASLEARRAGAQPGQGVQGSKGRAAINGGSPPDPPRLTRQCPGVGDTID